jgi:glycosyltransferase involved in cell wall biosynthesis
VLRQHVARIELLHLHSVFRAENIWAAALGRPYVLTPNGGYAPEVLNGRHRWLKLLWTRFWEEQLWSGARFLHAVSEREACALSALPSVPPIIVIPNGVRSQDVSDDAERPRQGSNWLFVGRLSVAQKGLDLLLQGYALAKQTCAVPPLRLVGPDFRGGQSTLEKLARALGLTGDVSFEGGLFGDDKKRVVKNAALLVQLSRWEGMPFTVLEALAMGVPVLVTPGTNIAESVARAEAGWTCDPSPASIAAIMVTIANSSAAERAHKSANAQRLMREQFLWAGLSEKMANAYRTVLARGRGDAI